MLAPIKGTVSRYKRGVLLFLKNLKSTATGDECLRNACAKRVPVTSLYSEARASASSVRMRICMDPDIAISIPCTAFSIKVANFLTRTAGESMRMRRFEYPACNNDFLRAR